MLSIAGMTSGQEGYYLNLAREDYFLKGGEPPGRWWGRGAKALGLDGEVSSDALSSLLRGRSPDGQALGQLQNYTDGRSHRPGWDLTFSAPKSVSAFWATADQNTRQQVQEIHDQAVRAAMTFLEEEAAWTRRGKGGESLEGAGLVAARFEHGTSRAQDPQLHTHVLVANVALRDDESFGALESLGLFQHKMTAGALYRVELAAGLQQRLGLEVRREDAWFELEGVPQEVAETFSTRRKEIEAALAEHGDQGPKAAELMAKTTRKVKEHVAREELFERWQGVAAEHGFTRDQARSLLSTERGAALDAARRDLSSRAAGIINDLMKHESHFSERTFLRRLAEAAQGSGLSAADVRDVAKRTLESDQQFISLPGRTPAREFTTKEMVETERSLLARAKQGLADDRHTVTDRQLHDVLSRRATLTEEQRDALRHITVRHGSIQCLSGMAGTGKTYLLDAAREAWTKAGYSVRGAALSGKAAVGLEDGARIESSTIASLLTKLDKHTSVLDEWKHHAHQLVRAAQKKPTWSRTAPLDGKTVLVIDEAGMVGTRDMARLLAHAEKARAKVVLVGDERQLAPIDAGAPFLALQREVGVARLTEITRQHEEWMRQAVREFADGDARGALSRFALANRLHARETRAQAMDTLIADWKKHRTQDPSQTLILAGTRAEVKDLNRRAQAERLAAGELSHRGSVKAQGETFHVGDRVLITKNDKVRGFRNGDFGTIESVQRHGITNKPAVRVRLDRTRAPNGTYDDDASTKRCAIRFTVDLDGNAPLQLGYASTVHKAQGATVDKAFVLAGGWMENRELAYVEMSRAREEAHIYTDTATAGEDLRELTAQMERSRQKDLAIERTNELTIPPPPLSQTHQHGYS